MPERAVEIEVWCDYVCPFCYLELPELARLQREFPTATITWRAFELRPDPVPTLDPDGRDLADPAVLRDTAASAELDPNALQAALTAGDHTQAVLGDERLAHALGINGVPGMLVHRGDRGRARRVSSAQPYGALRRVVEEVGTSSIGSNGIV